MIAGPGLFFPKSESGKLQGRTDAARVTSDLGMSRTDKNKFRVDQAAVDPGRWTVDEQGAELPGFHGHDVPGSMFLFFHVTETSKRMIMHTIMHFRT